MVAGGTTGESLFTTSRQFTMSGEIIHHLIKICVRDRIFGNIGNIHKAKIPIISHAFSKRMIKIGISNSLTAKLFYCNFSLLEVVPRFRDSQNASMKIILI